LFTTPAGARLSAVRRSALGTTAHGSEAANCQQVARRPAARTLRVSSPCEVEHKVARKARAVRIDPQHVGL